MTVCTHKPLWTESRPARPKVYPCIGSIILLLVALVRKIYQTHNVSHLTAPYPNYTLISQDQRAHHSVRGRCEVGMHAICITPTSSAPTTIETAVLYKTENQCEATKRCESQDIYSLLRRSCDLVVLRARHVPTSSLQHLAVVEEETRNESCWRRNVWDILKRHACFRFFSPMWSVEACSHSLTPPNVDQPPFSLQCRKLSISSPIGPYFTCTAFSKSAMMTQTESSAMRVCVPRGRSQLCTEHPGQPLSRVEVAHVADTKNHISFLSPILEKLRSCQATRPSSPSSWRRQVQHLLPTSSAAATSFER